VVNEIVPNSNANLKTHLDQAIRLRDEYLLCIAHGLPLHKKAKPTAADGTFCRAAERYMRIGAQDLSLRSRKGYEKHLRSIWMPLFGKRFLTDIADEDILEYFAAHDFSPKTKKNYIQVLSNVFEFAKAANPTRHLFKKNTRRARARKKVERYLPEEVAKLLGATPTFDATSGFQIRLYFTLFVGCGLRPQEILALEWDDYNGEFLHIRKCITYYQLEATTKTGQERKVYVPMWVRSALRDSNSRFAGGFIFPNTFGSYVKKEEIFNRQWKLAHAHCKLAYRDPYVCRHTRAAELISKGVPPAKGAEQLGNSVQVFLNTYAEWIDDYSETDVSVLESSHSKKFGSN
jgi:integrase